MLAHIRAEPAREAGEGRPDEAGIGGPILGTKRGADHLLAKPGQVRAGGVSAKELELKPVLGGVAGVALELRHVGFGAGELDMAGCLELNILPEHLVELVPDRAGAPRQRQLDETAPLLPNAAEIDAARAGPAGALLQEHDLEPDPAQRDRGRAAGDAAADDGHVRREALGHGTPPRTGIGLTGG